LYYILKPYFPRTLINIIKNTNSYFAKDAFPLSWPIERRYPQFLWEILKQLLTTTNQGALKFRHFWPAGQRFAFVLTHDIETEEGLALVREIANLEEELGFRSAFNFIPECYAHDKRLMSELHDRGFEIGVHGLNHDGKLFSSRATFTNRVGSINHYLKEMDAVGFRSPLTHRNPYWMQALEVEYDLSFFDTDPYEPMPGGCMSIWPFMIGRFIELPYTLAQDCTLGMVLGESTPRLWLEKIEFIKQYYGMALLNSHPDYLYQPKLWNMYVDLLTAVKDMNNYWHALPRDVARWWRSRAESITTSGSPNTPLGEVTLGNDGIVII
jgi:peptidoglycan/xylan/chitin deacetylase (PgdA/CDA1 family)